MPVGLRLQTRLWECTRRQWWSERSGGKVGRTGGIKEGCWQGDWGEGTVLGEQWWDCGLIVIVSIWVPYGGWSCNHIGTHKTPRTSVTSIRSRFFLRVHKHSISSCSTFPVVSGPWIYSCDVEVITKITHYTLQSVKWKMLKSFTMVGSNTTVILLCMLRIRIYLPIQCSKPSLHCGSKEWVLWWMYSPIPFSLSGSIRLLRVLRFSHWAFGEVSPVREMKAFDTQPQCFLEECAFCFPPSHCI